MLDKLVFILFFLLLSSVDHDYDISCDHIINDLVFIILSQLKLSFLKLKASSEYNFDP